MAHYVAFFRHLALFDSQNGMFSSKMNTNKIAEFHRKLQDVADRGTLS